MTQPITASIALAITEIHSRLQRSLAGRLSLHGISFSEFLILRQLAKAEGNKLRRIDLAQGAGLSASGITRLLNPMEKMGLVEKETASRDARVSLVALTPAGAKIFAEAEVSFQQVTDEFMSRLSEQEQQLWLGLLHKLGA